MPLACEYAQVLPADRRGAATFLVCLEGAVLSVANFVSLIPLSSGIRKLGAHRNKAAATLYSSIVDGPSKHMPEAFRGLGR